MSNKLEELLLRLYDSEQFYARLFFRVDRVVNDKMRTMGVGIKDNKLKLYYNPKFVEETMAIPKIGVKSAITVLKHEAFHFINKHLLRSVAIKNNDKSGATKENIAMDVAINQYLDKECIEAVNGITLEAFTKIVNNVPVLPNMTYEYYLDLLNKEQKRREEQNGSGNGDLDEQLKDYLMDDHGEFKPLDPLDQAILEDKIQKAMEETKASAGNLPKEIEDLLKHTKKAQINWKREMKMFIGDKLKSDKKSTRSKRNRRYGLLFAGKKKDYKAKILTVLDTSGSMSNKMIETCLNEIYGIYKTTPDLELDIVECDTKVQEVFTYKGEESFKIKGRGGTEFQPALDYAKQHKYDGIIFLTDGGCFDQPKNVGLPVLWGIVGGYKFDCDFGKILKIDSKE